ncbi:hypothetical protein [Sulfitobacter pacificus]|uniref:hypothetical protein n=1 Tax=Sulfitobacter pacificus TaxID=1499314 RepID=UPI003102A906
MAVISTEERRAIQQRLMSLGSPNLALIYGDATGEDASWTLNQPPVVVVVNLIGRLSESTEMAIIVCDALVLMTPNNASNPEITTIADCLRAQSAQAAFNPVQELWIGSEPMVNRGGLRALLSEIAQGYHHGVIYVAGGPMSGRSHSFHLIRHVARNWNIPHHRVDFALEIEARTLLHLYGALQKAYDLVDDDPPTEEGATPGDVASKFAARLRDRLAAVPLVNPKPWLVIDFSEDVPDPAVPEFIRLLCADRDANQFDNCVIFVLGPTAHLESMRGDLLNLQVEDLGPVAQTEIFEAAVVLNQRGQNKLDDATLGARAAQIYDDVTQLPEDAQFPALRRALLELRREVRAP